jgi:hypothetical protein
MLTQIVVLGLIASVVHFVAMMALYGNPVVSSLYDAANEDPHVRNWDSLPEVLFARFVGNLVEIMLISLAYFWLRPAVDGHGMDVALQMGLLLGAIRSYPVFWNMMIQTHYPRTLLLLEAALGLTGVVLVTCLLEWLSGMLF